MLVAALDDVLARLHLILRQPGLEHADAVAAKLLDQAQVVARRGRQIGREGDALRRALLLDARESVLTVGARGRVGGDGRLGPAPLLAEVLDAILFDEVVLLVGVDHAAEGGAREHLDDD